MKKIKTKISKALKALREPKLVIMKLNELRIRKIIINNYKSNPANFFFIQIGSNDGITGDLLYRFITKYKWQGILVEPVSYLFKKLKSNHSRSKDLIFENLAIAEEKGYKNFYRIEENNESDIPACYDQIGSFNKEVVISHRDIIPNFDKHFITEKVKCITFSDLLKKHNVKKINLLNIDAEGYDYEIIKTINFKEIKPKMILYEHKHLSERDRIACLELFKRNNYKIIVAKTDTFSYL